MKDDFSLYHKKRVFQKNFYYSADSLAQILANVIKVYSLLQIMIVHLYNIHVYS